MVILGAAIVKLERIFKLEGIEAIKHKRACLAIPIERRAPRSKARVQGGKRSALAGNTRAITMKG